MSIADNIASIRQTIPEHVSLVCVSKFQSVDALYEAYLAGERDFAESRVQELLTKQRSLPSDIRWHFIGHLQTNKVRAILPFISLIQSVDSLPLLQVIQAEASKINRMVHVLLEIHVAQETTKTGFQLADIPSVIPIILQQCPNIHVDGLMTMASNTDDVARIRKDFSSVYSLFHTLQQSYAMTILSMGMTEDYFLAMEEGSNMVRIGTAIFGERK